MTNMQQSNFDYQQLNTETRIVIQQRTGEIKALMKRTAQDIIEIGEKLIEVKERLEHGQFGAWLESEFRWSQDTASRFMNVAQRFQIPQFAEFDFAPSALYILSAPSVPSEARLEALERAQAGEQITHAKAKEIAQRKKSINDFTKEEKMKTPPHPDPFVDRFRYYDTWEEYVNSFTLEDWAEIKRRGEESIRLERENLTEEQKQQAEIAAEKLAKKLKAMYGLDTEPDPPPTTFEQTAPTIPAQSPDRSQRNYAREMVKIGDQYINLADLAHALKTQLDPGQQGYLIKKLSN